jgi:hypothetical protein
MRNTARVAPQDARTASSQFMKIVFGMAARWSQKASLAQKKKKKKKKKGSGSHEKGARHWQAAAGVVRLDWSSELSPFDERSPLF